MARARFAKVFGESVRKHRNEQDLSQEVLAEIAEIHRTHVGFIERGEQSPSLDVAHRVAAALGLRLATLVAEAEERVPPDPRVSERRRRLRRPRRRPPPPRFT
jgi:DNA-binding XRE family transcriptional regulator